jgi:hypothetical protein
LRQRDCHPRRGQRRIHRGPGLPGLVAPLDAHLLDPELSDDIPGVVDNGFRYTLREDPARNNLPGAGIPELRLPLVLQKPDQTPAEGALPGPVAGSAR